MKRIGKSIRRVWLVGVVLAGAAPLRPAEPLNPPAPLLAALATGSSGDRALTRTAADRATELGFSSQAVDLYRLLLADAAGGDRTAIGLALATALLEAGRAEEAEKVLSDRPEPRSAAWQLRVGLAALQLRKYEAVRPALAAIVESELSATDAAWYWFLQGAAVDVFSPQDTARANEFYLRAENAPGVGELARARFQLAAEEMRLRKGVAPTREQLKAAKDSADRFAGTAFGYDAARNYVLLLLAQNQRSEAATYLQTLLPIVPAGERKWWDDFRLMTGLIGERGRSFAARKALTELLENGKDPRRQRQALQLLWEASASEPARSQLRVVLDKLTAAGAKHPIAENLLLYRAQLAMAERKYDEVLSRTGELLEKFPASPLRLPAFGLLTQLAWEQRRYRSAADNARKARAELAETAKSTDVAVRAELTLVEAEAWFRAGLTAGDRNDFRNAADAYAAALRERPRGVQPGDLMYQRVLAETKAGSPDAARILDELAADPAFDLENRWQAEWSLARALLVDGKTAEAFARVTALVQRRAEAGQVNPQLRVRLAWLQVRLSLEANQPRQTITLADALLSALGEIPEALRVEVASTTLLRKAAAEFRLGREAGAASAKELEASALATLQKVRAEYPKSDAAIQSYLIESDYYAESDRIQDAQRTLITVTEKTDYRESESVPFAYYQLALLSERLGQKKDLEEANRRIEELVKTPAATLQGELVFLARMKQGELLRRLNQFPQAERVYFDLTTRPASPENAIMARLELAKTHNAQASTDTDVSQAHADSAQLLFAELCERVDASPDVRVEAGFFLGELLVRRGKLEEAARVWFRDVVTPFLIEDRKRVEAGATRPYWLARTLLGLGGLYEQQGKLEDARNAYAMIAAKRLGWGEALARKGLERLGLPATRG